MNYQKIISINGAPRSGTSWLGQLFNSSPQVRFKFQPFYSYAFRDKIGMDDAPEKSRAFFDALYQTREEYLDREVQIEKGIYPRFSVKDDSPAFLALKSVKYHYLVPKFLRELEDFVLVAIVRNPKAAIYSFLGTPKEFDPSLDRLAEWRFAQTRNGFRPEYYYGFHRWMECNRLFLEMEKQYPGRVQVLSYEKLVQNTESVLGECFEKLGISMHDQTRAFIAKASETYQANPYSVFRGQGDKNAWKTALEPQICEAIDAALAGTPLAVFAGEPE